MGDTPHFSPHNANGYCTDELDSYMYQTVGHDAIDLYSGCMGIPLFRREIKGSSVSQGADYRPTDADEVEDLYELLSEVKVPWTSICAALSLMRGHGG